MISDFHNKYPYIKSIQIIYSLINDVLSTIIDHYIMLIKCDIINIQHHDQMVYNGYLSSNLTNTYLKTNIRLVLVKQTSNSSVHCVNCYQVNTHILRTYINGFVYYLPYCCRDLERRYDKLVIFDNFLKRYMNNTIEY